MTLTYFQDHGGQFQHENFQFSLVSTITQQILIALGTNLYHGLRVTNPTIDWHVRLSVRQHFTCKHDDSTNLYHGLRVTNPTIDWHVRLSVRQHFTCKHDDSTNISRIGPKFDHGCILGVSWLSLKIYYRDLFFAVMGCRFQHENL